MFTFANDATFENFSDHWTIVVFELPKVPTAPVPGDSKQKWLARLKAGSPEALQQVKDLYPEPVVQKAVDAILELNADRTLRDLVYVRDYAYGFRDYDDFDSKSGSKTDADGDANVDAE